MFEHRKRKNSIRMNMKIRHEEAFRRISYTYEKYRRNCSTSLSTRKYNLTYTVLPLYTCQKMTHPPKEKKVTVPCVDKDV